MHSRDAAGYEPLEVDWKHFAIRYVLTGSILGFVVVSTCSKRRQTVSPPLTPLSADFFARRAYQRVAKEPAHSLAPGASVSHQYVRHDAYEVP